MKALLLSKYELRVQIILTLIVAVTACVTGCIANVPVRTDRPSKSFEMDYVKTHLRSTEQEIIEQLGLPGLVLRSGTETYYVYRATADLRRVAGIILIVPPYFFPFFTAREDDEALHCLALVFDESGLLQEYKTATGSEEVYAGMLAIPAPVELPPIGKEEKNCVIALWGEEDRQSLEYIAAYEQFVCPGNLLDHAAWFCPQADKGIADPQRRIGDLYYCGGGQGGSTRDPVRAYVWYSLAARGNNSLAKARLNIVEKELSQDELREAQRLLEAWVPGQCKKDIVKLQQYKVKAQQDKRDIEREVLAQDRNTRADQGDLEAQFELYILNPNSEEGLRWLCTAANQGHVDAQISLGDLYSSRNRGPRYDPRWAYVWLSLAALEGGKKRVSYELFEVRRSMNPKQLDEAEKMLANWKPGQCERDLVPAVPGN